MNANQRSVFIVVVAVGIATLACSPLSGGAVTKNTQVASAPAVTQVAVSTPAPAVTQVAASTPTPATGSAATGVASPTYDTVAAQSTVPPLLTANAATAVAATGALRQWASAAKASSQYGDLDWAAAQATGAPNSSPNCSDQTTAWASGSSDAVDNLELTYTTTVVPVSVNIYENDAPGSIVKVDVEEANGAVHTVYTGLPLLTSQCPRIFSIGISGISSHVNRVKIYLDQSVIGNWDEIDAVELVGNP
jgi:hypothetical protein